MCQEFFRENHRYHMVIPSEFRIRNQVLLESDEQDSLVKTKSRKPNLNVQERIQVERTTTAKSKSEGRKRFHHTKLLTSKK